MSVYYLNGEMGVCSRNYELKQTNNSLYWNLFERKGLRESLSKLGKNLAIQGELIGQNIQGNKNNINGNKWFIFDIYDIDKRRYLKPQERYDIVQILCLNHVPIKYENIKPFQKFNSLDDLLLDAETMGNIKVIGDEFSPNPKIEGVFYKSIESIDEQIISFKAISNNWLLKNQ